MPVPAVELARQPPFDVGGASLLGPDWVEWTGEIPDNCKEGRQLLADYSKVPEDELDKHILLHREKAYAVWPYPCIGRFRFLNVSIAHHPQYVPTLQLLKADANANFLDFGCCVGQDLRKLAHDGVPASQLFGADKELEFLQLGYQLFRDEDRMPRDHFFEGDALAEPATPAEGSLGRLDGKMTVVHAASFFHLFGWEDQVRVGRRIVRFLRQGSKDCLVFGRQVGTTVPGNYERTTGALHGVRFAHDDRTVKELWDVIGKDTGTQWAVEARLYERADLKDMLAGAGERGRTVRRLEYSARLTSWDDE